MAEQKRKRKVTGKTVQTQTPVWEPLGDAARGWVLGEFMWMFEVELKNGKRVHAYKHSDTRRYVHLDAKGNAYAYCGEERYLPIDAREAFDAAINEAYRDLGYWERVERERELHDTEELSL
jgi:hypothetical protein